MVSKIDCTELGLKCGIEVHQQIFGKKLFCSCPAEIEEGAPDYEIKRYLRASAGETGEIDVAAKAEQEKEKYYLYYGYLNSCCLFESDSEPPHDMNQEALSTVLQVAMLLNAKIVDNVQVMRKTVVDGSNTSGFQRTALVGYNGYIDSSGGKVGVPTVIIEEEAAKIVERTKDYDIYNLSRLGIPLIEIATDPDIKTAAQCKEVAEKIGMILRSTGKVKRGLGTIRQDVNVSIKGGDRIEIKGAQELKMIPTWVEYECARQKNLLEMFKDKVKIKREFIDVSSLFQKTDCTVFKNALDKKGIILALKLPGFLGKTGFEIQPGKRLGTELSDFAKVKAGVKGLFHTDELPKYGITEEDVIAVSERLGCDKKDGFILISDEKMVAVKALNVVVDRLNLFYEGIPREVRKPNQDGTSTYMRPMPGASRMYPETDVQPIKTDVSSIKKPELLEEKEKKFIKLGLGKDLARLIVRNKDVSLIESYFKKYKKIKPAFIAETMLSTTKELKRKNNIEINLSEKDFEIIFDNLDKEIISKDVIADIILDIAKGKFTSIDTYKSMSDEDLEKEIKKIIAESKDVPANALIGRVMGKLRGKAPGQKIVEMVRKFSNQ